MICEWKKEHAHLSWQSPCADCLAVCLSHRGIFAWIHARFNARTHAFQSVCMASPPFTFDNSLSIGRPTSISYRDIDNRVQSPHYATAPSIINIGTLRRWCVCVCVWCLMCQLAICRLHVTNNQKLGYDRRACRNKPSRLNEQVPSWIIFSSEWTLDVPVALGMVGSGVKASPLNYH